MPERTVIMLHGLGGDRNSMLPIAKYCSRLLPGTQFLPVEGTLNFGGLGQSRLGWFIPPDDNRRALDGRQPPRLNGLERSLETVHQVLDELIDGGMDPVEMHLLGHSQGGAIAIAAGLTYPVKLGTVCTIAGYLALTPKMKSFSTGTRYFLHHSIHDDNVSFRWADYARSFLEKTGNYCVVRSWDIRTNPHSVHNVQLDAICDTIGDAPTLAR